jgi:hypothetical protein
MTTVQWIRFLEDQKRQGKSVFTLTELAHAAGSSLAVARVTAHRLAVRGVLDRVGHGRYALPNTLSVVDTVRAMDSGAYVTAEGALYLHGMATQVPQSWTCFTNKRHGRSRVRSSASGRITFVCVIPRIYRRPDDAALAPPEQALCDFVHVAMRSGVTPESLLTLRHLERLNPKLLRATAKRYGERVEVHVLHLVDENLHRRPRRSRAVPASTRKRVGRR